MNKVSYHISDEIIFIKVSGRQTADSIKDLIGQISVTQQYFHLQVSSTKVLIDAIGAGAVEPSALQAAEQLSEVVDAMAVAIVRDGGFMKSVIGWMVQHLPHANRIQVFDDTDTARRWLLNLTSFPSRNIS